jgi:hypothetical protein
MTETGRERGSAAKLEEIDLTEFVRAILARMIPLARAAGLARVKLSAA